MNEAKGLGMRTDEVKGVKKLKTITLFEYCAFQNVTQRICMSLGVIQADLTHIRGVALHTS